MGNAQGPAAICSAEVRRAERTCAVTAIGQQRDLGSKTWRDAGGVIEASSDCFGQARLSGVLRYRYTMDGGHLEPGCVLVQTHESGWLDS